MNITEGIRVGKLHSHHDFDLCIKSRNIGLPEKKSIRETVPFMNGYYDFTALSGAPAWGERINQYAFDVIAYNPVELDAAVTKVLDWLCNIHDEDIFDDAMPDYHWHGSYDSSSVTWDDSGMQAEISVEFVCYPFKIANEPTTLRMVAGEYTVTNVGMTVAPIVKSDANAAIQIGSYVSSIPADTEIMLEIDLVRGDNAVVVTGDGTVEFSFYVEVM